MAPAIIAQLIPVIMQGVKAISDKNNADNLSDINRPIASVTPAMQELITRARMLSGQTKVPGADVLENQLLSTSAAGVNDINQMSSSSSSGLSAISNLYGKQMESEQSLGVRNDDYHNKMVQELLSQLPGLGAEQLRVDKYNNQDPYDNAKKAEAAFRYSSSQNASNAGSGVSNMFGALANLPA